MYSIKSHTHLLKKKYFGLKDFCFCTVLFTIPLFCCLEKNSGIGMATPPSPPDFNLIYFCTFSHLFLSFLFLSISYLSFPITVLISDKMALSFLEKIQSKILTKIFFLNLFLENSVMTLVDLVNILIIIIIYNYIISESVDLNFRPFTHWGE